MCVQNIFNKTDDGRDVRDKYGPFVDVTKMVLTKVTATLEWRKDYVWCRQIEPSTLDLSGCT